MQPPQKKLELDCDFNLIRAIHGYSFTSTINFFLSDCLMKVLTSVFCPPTTL